MRKRFFLLSLFLTMCWAFGTVAQACVVLSVVSGADTVNKINANVAEPGEGLELLAKWEFKRKKPDVYTGLEGFEVVLESRRMGSWSSPFDVLAVAIKAGPQFTLLDFTMDKAVQGSLWCTNGACAVASMTLPELYKKSKNKYAKIKSISLYGLQEVIAPAVPEPKTWLMLLFGFAFMAFAVKNKRQRSF